VCKDGQDQHCDLYARGLQFKPCRKPVIQTKAFHDFAQSFWENSLSVRNLSYEGGGCGCGSRRRCELLIHVPE